MELPDIKKPETTPGFEGSYSMQKKLDSRQDTCRLSDHWKDVVFPF